MSERWTRWVLVIVTAFVAAPKLVHVWSSSPIFSLGFLVAPWAVWWVARLPDADAKAPHAVRLGLLLVAMALAISGWYLAAPFLALWAVVVALLLVAVEKGRPAGASLSLLVLALSVPPPGFDGLLADAQSGVTASSALVLGAIGLPVTIEAFTLIAPTYRFTVTPACSGFAGLLSSFALIGIVGMHLSAGWRRLGLALAVGLGLTVALNVARVVVLVWVTETSGPMLIESAFHEGISLALSIVAALVVIPILHQVPIPGEPRIIVEASP
ncbi:MAG: exosortase/archaeosortase family protein [Euryarchaeota archaeon]|nr:exosortase/archaeosortase family protein [Euryarchaeota archaeon]